MINSASRELLASLALLWQMSAAQPRPGAQQALGAVARVSYLTGFSAAFGTSVWVTFVAGVVLFR